jgi:hypothetical protein
MPLLEINQSRHICASVRLDEVTATQVDQYAAFIHASADDVVDKALNYVFSKDRDFQDFLKTAHAKQVAPALRVRKGPSNGATEQPTKKLAAGVESTASGRSEGMIVHPISWWCKNGASHRENFDTPSLKGSCRCTTVHLQRFQGHTDLRCTWVHL